MLQITLQTVFNKAQANITNGFIEDGITLLQTYSMLVNTANADVELEDSIVTVNSGDINADDIKTCIKLELDTMLWEELYEELEEEGLVLVY